MVRLASVALIAAATLAGCGGEPPPPERPLAGPVVVERVGGVGGIDTRLTIRPDGTAGFQEGGGLRPAAEGPVEPVEVDPPQLAALEEALAGWDDVDPDQGPPDSVADAIATTITYDGHAVLSGDGTAPDDDLRPVLDAVTAIAP